MYRNFDPFVNIFSLYFQKDVEEYMQKNSITDLLVVNGELADDSDSDTTSSSTTNGNGNLVNLHSNSVTSNGINSSFGLDNSHLQSPTSMQPPPVPPRAFEAKNDGFGDSFIRYERFMVHSHLT